MASRNNDVGGGILFGLMLLAGFVAMMTLALKAAPVLWRGLVALTDLALDPLALLLSGWLGWPATDSGDMTTGTAAFLGACLWGTVSVVGAILMWLLSGVHLLLLAGCLGTILGAAAGAATVGHSPPATTDGLDDVLSPW